MSAALKYCRGRKFYFTRKTALHELEGDLNKRAYRCPDCHGWHLTDKALGQDGRPRATPGAAE